MVKKFFSIIAALFLQQSLEATQKKNFFDHLASLLGCSQVKNVESTETPKTPRISGNPTVIYYRSEIQQKPVLTKTKSRSNFSVDLERHRNECIALKRDWSVVHIDLVKEGKTDPLTPDTQLAELCKNWNL